jgi:hypothetical protein
MRTLVEPLMKQVGFELRADDQPLDVHLRRLAVSWACSLGIKVAYFIITNYYYSMGIRRKQING